MDFDLMRHRLVQARKLKGYNRKQFAEMVGIPYRTVTNYENGAREPGSDYITKVADFCNCTTDWLLGLTENPQFEDITNELDIDDEVRQLAKQYSQLSDDDRELIKKMVNSLAEKLEK